MPRKQAPMSLIDPPPPWTPEAEQRTWLADNQGAEHGPDLSIASAVQQVRKQIADKTWEAWAPGAEPQPQ